MRGNNTKHAAVVIDLEGTEHYRIVPTAWVRVIIAGFALMLFLMIILALILIINRHEIDTLRDQIQVNTNDTQSTRNSDR